MILPTAVDEGYRYIDAKVKYLLDVLLDVAV